MVECFLGAIHRKSQRPRPRRSNGICTGTRIFVIVTPMYLPTTLLSSQHQVHQNQHRHALQHRIPGTSLQQLPIGQQPQPSSIQPQPGPRLPNGIPPRPGLGFSSTVPNGVAGSMQPGGPTSFPIPGPLPNGLPGQPGPPPPGGVPPVQPQNYPQMHAGQRPSLSGPQPPQNPQQPPPSQGSQPPQQRGQSNGPFPSPTMAHSPQNPPGMQPQQHPQQPPPMGQLAGPSPHLQHLPRGSMHPPQGMNPVNPQQGPGPGGNPPSASSQFQRSPSRAGTPAQGQGGMMQPSPSMAPRPMPGTAAAVAESLNAELTHIPPAHLQQLKQEVGIGPKELSALTSLDKVGFRACSRYEMLLMLKFAFIATDTGCASATETWRWSPTAKQCNTWSFKPDDATPQSWTE